MKDDRSDGCAGIILLFLLSVAIIMVALKLIGVIHISWFWVLCPIWCPAAICFAAICVACAVVLINELLKYISASWKKR